jgi:methionyl-tRNA formyltransferase
MARLAFFGTPDFAVPSLEALLKSGHEVACVVCQADKPKGRGKKLQPPPVKARAHEAGLLVLQPATLKKGTDSGDTFAARFSELGVDLAVVTAYGRIIPRRILAVPKHGFVNVHGSLLPRWRGAAPVQRAIQAGDPRTGICLMDMVYELDAGDVYAASAVPITHDDDGETLSARLAELGGELLLEHLDAILSGDLERTSQPEDGVTYAHMLKKEEAILDFDRPALQVDCHVRAMVPWPGSQTTLDGEVLKVFSPRVADHDPVDAAPGTVLEAADELVVACRDSAVAFSEAQLPGKKRMKVSDLVRGRPIEAGTRLG